MAQDSTSSGRLRLLMPETYWDKFQEILHIIELSRLTLLRPTDKINTSNIFVSLCDDGVTCTTIQEILTTPQTKSQRCESQCTRKHMTLWPISVLDNMGPLWFVE